MSMKKFYFLYFALLLAFSGYAQNPHWMNYTNGDHISSIAYEGEYLWIGTYNGGLVKLDKANGSTTFYNRANSGLPNNRIRSIAIDQFGNK
jgi:hypothetical protein